MKVTSSMMHPDIRFSGKLNGVIYATAFASESSMRLTQKCLKKLYTGKTSKKIHCESRMIRKKNGEPLRICIYRRLQAQPNATGLLWIHGGGYAVGLPEYDMKCMENILSVANCVIVSPDYTLSTEKPYPAALEDCYDALLWLKENSDALGVRSDQLFVGGYSAGGGLTIATSMYARDKREVNIAFQMPLYPMIDDTMQNPSAQDNNAPVWTSKSNALGWKMYLGSLFGTDDVPKYAAPAREDDYYGLPPAYTFVGDIEAFHDETLAYISNLKQAGILAKVDVYAGCWHGFDLMSPNAKISRYATEKMLNELKYAVNNYFAPQTQTVN